MFQKKGGEKVVEKLIVKIQVLELVLVESDLESNALKHPSDISY